MALHNSYSSYARNEQDRKTVKPMTEMTPNVLVLTFAPKKWIKPGFVGRLTPPKRLKVHTRFDRELLADVQRLAGTKRMVQLDLYTFERGYPNPIRTYEAN